MNFDKHSGYQLFKILKKNDDSKKPKMVYMGDHVDSKGSFTSFECADDEIIEVVPDNSHERECVSLYGRSGVGKSYQVRKYVENFVQQKGNSKKNIILFSSLTEDKTLDKLGKKLKRVKLDKNFLSTGIDIKIFAKSLIIFDDIDVITNRQIKAKVYKILDSCLQIGRHHEISIIITSHNFSNNENRVSLNESHKIFCFPQSGLNKAVIYMLENYRSLTPKQANNLKKKHGRWVCVHSGKFSTVICENKAYMLNMDDEDD